MDKLYSKGSRIATEMGGIAERLWGNMSAKQGDENSVRLLRPHTPAAPATGS